MTQDSSLSSPPSSSPSPAPKNDPKGNSRNNRKKRLLLFFAGTPLIVLVPFLTQGHFLLANFLLFLIAGISSHEVRNLFLVKGITLPLFWTLAAGLILPITRYFQIVLFPDMPVFPFIFTLMLLLFLIRLIFVSNSEEMKDKLFETAGLFTIFLYIGYLVNFWVRLSEWDSPFIYILFLLVVIFNDSIAWLTGILFGKKNRNLLAISPQKSLAGFIGGILSTLGIILLGKLFFPRFLPVSWGKVILAGLILGFSSIIGDLVESSLKRSANIKDSGHVVMGRGGMLDSIDSFLFVGPIYYYLMIFLQEPLLNK